MDARAKINDGYQQHSEMSQHQLEPERVYQAAKTVDSRKCFHNTKISYIIYATTIILIIIMASVSTLRAIGLVVGSAVGLACWSHSRWGFKAKASLEQFHLASYNPAPADWLGPLFKPRLNYPRECPPAREMPWEKIDFKKEPERYMHSILDYCMEGNVENGFVPQKNSRRSWYHAPWMSQNNIGREPIHGLTFERPAPVGYLADSQDRVCQSWAVAMYNEQGGYAFGEMWNKLGQPIKKHAKFPLNTVTFKLLFTEATPKEIPFLKGSPTWKATIAQDPLQNKLKKGPSNERTLPVDMHFLQVDIAVRDSRADDTTGWVFGTFMYHDSVKNDNPWKRLMPVCLMWGNDPDLTQEKYDQGERPKESWINPKAAETLPKTRPYFGWLGRGNGPIDNFKSSCISCHSTASHPEQKSLYKEKYTPNYTIMDWFRNIKAGEKFRPNAEGVSLDYSLQMSSGFQNYKNWSEKWRPFPKLPLYWDKHVPDAGSPPGMLNARGIDISDYEDEDTKNIISHEEVKQK